MLKVGQKVIVKSCREINEDGFVAPLGIETHSGREFVIKKVDNARGTITVIHESTGFEIGFPTYTIKEVDEQPSRETQPLKVGQVVQFKTREEVGDDFYPSDVLNYLGEDFFIRELDDANVILECSDGEVLMNRRGERPKTFESYLLKESTNTKLKPLEVGDIVDFIDEIQEFKTYGKIVPSRYMSTFQGQRCTVANIDLNDGTFNVEEDERRYWFDRSMLKQYQRQRINRHELSVGDEVIISKTLKVGRYDGVNMVDYMLRFRGQTTTITEIDTNSKGNLIYTLALSSGYVWSASMFEKTPSLSIRRVIKEQIGVNCRTISQRNELFRMLKEKGIIWRSSDEIDIEDESDFKQFNGQGTCYKVREGNRLCFSSKSSFEEDGYKVMEFEELFVTKDKGVDDFLNVQHSKKATKSAFINRGFRVGDMYYLDDVTTPNHNGWRIAMNGYSIGLNSYDDKSWTSLKHDENLKITKLIPTDRQVTSYSNMSLFLKTFDEKLVENMIIHIVE